MVTKQIRLVPLFILTLFSIVTPQSMAIAVIDLQGKGISQVEASALTDRLRSEIMNVSSATMVERDEMDQILGEQDFQQTGCVSSECMVEVGQLIGVTQIIGGSISKVGNTFSVHARIIDVETGEIVYSVNYDRTGTIDELLISGMRNVSQLLFAASEGDYVELGKDYEYYDSGQLKAEGRSVSGVKLGKWIFYYENGWIQKVGNYKDGKEIGVWTYYYENGKTQKVGDYEDGIKKGEWAYYYENDNIQKVGDYKDGIENGEWAYYYENGTIQKVGDYDDGIKNGEWTYNYENGRIRSTGNYEDGKRVGKWTYYLKDGEIQYIVDHDVELDITNVKIIPDKSFLGRLSRREKVIEYYQDGEIKAKANRELRRVHGKRIVYSVSGEVLHKYWFNFGNGYYVDYYENGQIREEGHCRYYDGMTMTRLGTWTKFSPLGEIISKIEYDHNGNVQREKHY